jgi:nucleoside-diphosphate-sugar epimerase
MSSGDQLREYHHADDIAASLSALLEKEWTFGPTIEISSGKPVKLGDLAQAVFRAFKKEKLLKIGALPKVSGEVIQDSYERSPDWLLVAERDPIAGVIDSIRAQL